MLLPLRVSAPICKVPPDAVETFKVELFDAVVAALSATAPVPKLDAVKDPPLAPPFPMVVPPVYVLFPARMAEEVFVTAKPPLPLRLALLVKLEVLLIVKPDALAMPPLVILPPLMVTAPAVMF